MNATVLYLTKATHENDIMSILVGADLYEVVKDAINIYDIDLAPHVVIEAFEEMDGTSVSFGSWTFESGYLGDKSNLVLSMSIVERSDDWRGEDGDY